MAASGNPYDGPKACPFLALELDRDRRSERPDYRHRCFAETTPAPRSIAHQETFCLSPGFSACPIFQDWALRAAARPVGAPLPEPAAGTAAAAAAGLGVVAGAPSLGAASDIEPSIDDELPPLPPLVPVVKEPDSMPAPEEDQPELEAEPEPPYPGPDFAAADDEPPAPAAWPPDEPAEAEQLGAFDDPAASTSLPGALTAPIGDDDLTDMPDTQGYVPPPARRDDPESLADEAAVPAFLAGRAASQAAAPRPSTALPPPQSLDRVTREDLVPSWEIDGRYGAEGPADDDGGGRFDSILTAIAVIAILALGVAGVLFLPGLLAGGGSPNRTPPPSFAQQSQAPSAVPSPGASDLPSLAPQTAAPTDAGPTASPAEPGASPRLYRIKAGDTLFRIARRFDTTVEAILAANPEIGDPNDIFAGQLIAIPPP